MKNKLLVLLNNFLIIPVLMIVLFYILNFLFMDANYAIVMGPIFFSLLIYFVLVFLFLGLFGDTKKAHVTLCIIILILILISYIKVAYTNEPLFLSDLDLFNSCGEIFSFVKGDLFKIILLKYKPIIIAIFILVALIRYSDIFKYKVENTKIRCILLCFGIFIFYVLFSYNSCSRYIYKKLLYVKDYSSYTEYKQLYGAWGIISGMYKVNYENNDFMKYDKYSDKELDDVVSKVSFKSNNNIGTPNIVVILSESFFDTNLLKDDIIYDRDLISNINALKGVGYFVDLISPSYGGMTANVSYQLLTGSNMSIYGNGYIPFMQQFGDNKKYPSVVRELKNNGYTINEYTGSDPYKISKQFKAIGFDEYTVINSNGHKKGYYLSDDYVADLIIKKLKNNTNKQFMLFETMQNHMDYLFTKYDKYDISIKKSKFTKTENGLFLSYGQGVYDADKMLKKVYDYIQTIDADTLIVFFGDHLPYFKFDGNVDLVTKMSYFNTLNDLDNLYRRYNTQALILSNYDVKLDIQSHLSTDNLLVSIINQMDIKLSNYYKWLYDTINYLPSYNKYVAVDKNGNLKYIEDLNANEKRIYELKNALTYRYYIKNK